MSRLCFDANQEVQSTGVQGARAAMLALAAPGASARPHEACAVLWSRLAPLAAVPGESAGSEEAAGGAPPPPLVLSGHASSVTPY